MIGRLQNKTRKEQESRAVVEKRRDAAFFAYVQ